MVDLNVFCDPSSEPTARYDLSTPWVYDGWRYATDDRICVRELAPGEPSSPDARASGSNVGKRPRAHELFAKFPKKGFTRDWPTGGEETMIAGRRIAGWAVARIGLLDGVKFRPDRGSEEDAICFIDAHGRQGKVMPMVPIGK